MKIICDICGAEITVDNTTDWTVVCSICGKVMVRPKIQKKNLFLSILMPVSALLFAIIFALVLINQNRLSDIKNNPLKAEITNTNVETDDYGVKNFKVAGRIENRSNHAYGLPNVTVVSVGEKDSVIGKKTFYPPVSILGAGEYVEFEYFVPVLSYDVSKLNIELEKVE